MYKPEFYLRNGEVEVRCKYPVGAQLYYLVIWTIAAWKFLIDNIKDIKSPVCSTADAICVANSHGDCKGCPIEEYTGQPDCDGSGWHKVDDALEDGNTDDALRYANVVVDMLRNILRKTRKEELFMTWRQ